MKWTKESVKLALGYKPTKQYMYQTRERRVELTKYMSPLEAFNRQTGKTTDMLCEMVAAALNQENILVVCWNKYQLISTRQHVDRMIANLPFETDSMKLGAIDLIVSKEGKTYSKVLVDHTVLGQ